MNAKALKAYLAQPSTIKGFAAILSVLSGGLAQVLSHDVTASVGIAGMVWGVVHVVMPDNSAAQTPIEKLVQDGIQATVQGRLSQMLPVLFGDGMAVLNALQQPTTTTVVTTLPGQTTQTVTQPIVPIPPVLPPVIPPAAPGVLT